MKIIATAPCLVHYNPTLPIAIHTDASQYHIAAVLVHTFPNKEEHPVAFASSRVKEAEKNYSTTEREFFAIYYAPKTFYTYVYSKKFIANTDHQPC